MASTQGLAAVAATGRLLERERELAEVQRLLGGVSSGAGELLVVESPAGAGKTRLLDALCRAADDRRMTVLAATCSELERDLGFGVVRSLFGPLLARCAPARRRSLLSGAAGFAAPVVSPRPSVADLHAADPASTLHGLFWLASNLSESGPLVLVIDDGQWADGPSLRFAAYLARRLDDLGMLLAVAGRAREPGAEADLISALLEAPRAHVMRLAPLSERAVAVLVRERLATEPAQEFCTACHAASGGNPFLVGELLSSLASDRVAPTARNSERISEIGPGSVARVVLTRLARVGLEATGLAKAVSVLGGHAELRHAAALAALEPEVAARAADALAEIEVFSPARPVRFVHPLVHNAIYGAIGPSERSVKHGTAACLLAAEDTAPDLVAAHLLQAEPAGEEWVVRALRAAAADASARGAPAQAAAYLRRALAEPPAGDLRAAVLHQLGESELLARDPGAIDHLAQALAADSDPERRGEIALLLGRAAVHSGRFADARVLLGEAIGELGDSHPEMAARLETYRSAAGVWDPRFAEELRQRVPALRALASRAGAGGRSLLLLIAFRLVFDGGRPADVLGLVERGWGRGELIERESAEAIEVTWAARALTFIDEVDRAEQVVDTMLADARRRGSVTGYAFASAWQADIALRRGQVANAGPEARSAIELATEHGLDLVLPHAYSFLGEVLIEQGDAPQAVRLLASAGLDAMRGTRPASRFLHVRARAHLASGDGQAAIGDLRACQEIQESSGLHNPNVFSWRSTLALALPDSAHDEAVSLVASELELARRIGQPRAIGIALRAAALLSARDAQVELLREAVGVLKTCPSRLEQARALTDLGAALRRAGQRADARQPLRAGMDLAAACGASALATRARGELVAAGARPRRERVAGRQALTTSELRVAEMAAAGLTNRQIAQALFVTMKTIAMHLTHSYEKLDISGREQLPAALGVAEDGRSGQ